MDRFQEILHQIWGYDDFRGIQREIIESIAQGRDTLGLMPTGGGKSITFQVPALAQEGMCLVITPLIALMKDQIAHLRQRGITAGAVYSGMTRDDIVKTLDNAIYGAFKFLYVSPERLSSELFVTKVRNMHISFITVDEAHCISQWGYDFRPAYLRIALIREVLSGKPLLALTATATPKVIDDIQVQLKFVSNNVLRMSFERENLSYIVRKTYYKEEEMLHILHSTEGSAIVYARSRQKIKEISDLLNRQGITATFYHAGLEAAVKDQRQKDWQEEQCRVMVATNAFGMGIDKADVRLVIHTDVPDSVEAYFQEAGRAGRDGHRAYSVLLYNKHDRYKLNKRIADNFPPKEYIRDVYEHLAYFFQIGINSGEGSVFEFNIDLFCKVYKYFPVKVESALYILQNAGYIKYDADGDGSARVAFTLSRDALYKLKGNSSKEDAVIVALLRNYGGLFSRLCNIDESLIAQQTGLDRHQVYVCLKSLRQKNILQFIPRKKIPNITFMRDRENGSRIIISKEVYEDRLERYIKQVEAILSYAEEERICRSRLLLRYFGEEKTKDCRHCDVCIEDHQSALDKQKNREAAQKAILDLLQDEGPHPITRLYAIKLPREWVTAALDYLCSEEIIYMEDSLLYLSKARR